MLIKCRWRFGERSTQVLPAKVEILSKSFSNLNIKNMKKYAFLVVAAILVVTASAFVIASQSHTESSTYWFLMDESGTSVTTTQVSDPASLCSDQLIEPDCARQYSESQTEIVNGVRTVKASEVDNPIDFRSKNP